MNWNSGMDIKQLTPLYLYEPIWHDINDVSIKLLYPLEIMVDGERITIPADFSTDFGSIPQIFRGMYDPRKGRVAYTLHDWACVNRLPPSSDYWAEVLHQMLLPLGHSEEDADFTNSEGESDLDKASDALTIYLAVRYGGPSW